MKTFNEFCQQHEGLFSQFFKKPIGDAPATGDSAQLGANHGKLEITNGQVFFISDEGQKTPLGPEGQVKMQHSNFHNQEWWEIFTPKSLR